MGSADPWQDRESGFRLYCGGKGRNRPDTHHLYRGLVVERRNQGKPSAESASPLDCRLPRYQHKNKAPQSVKQHAHLVWQFTDREMPDGFARKFDVNKLNGASLDRLSGKLVP
jgi:hypothetical protein